MRAGQVFGPVRVAAEVLSVKTSGGYVVLTLVAGRIAERARPGTFVMVSVGGEGSGLLLPRAFWLHGARASGAYGGTIDVAFTARSTATRWLAGLRAHDLVGVTGPLGRPFALPREPVSCVLVGSGYRSAPLLLLADRLRERECPVHMVLGGDAEAEAFGVLEARRTTQSVTVVDQPGPAGYPAMMQALGGVIDRHGADVVYGCGPAPLVADVARIAAARGAWTQVAVETAMTCGVGLCAGCLVPVRGTDGVTRPLRCCFEGPVFAGGDIDWDLMRPQWTSA